MVRQTDDAVGIFALGVILGMIIVAVILMFSNDNISYHKFEDGNAVLCKGNEVLVVRDGFDETWYTPESGLEVNLCK